MGIPIVGAETPIGGLSLPLVVKDRPYSKTKEKKVKQNINVSKIK
jgi:hypothetical protein